jgi:membrane associated rhomboid family serine protease
MSRYPRSSSYGIGYPTWTPAVRALIITCVVVFLLQSFDRIAGGVSIADKFGLSTTDVTEHYYLWQLVTYIFLHSTSGIGHILFNMLSLWMFGSDLERAWGTRRFLRYFFICGIGAGICTVVVEALLGRHSVTIGASGAIYGILLAYGLTWPDRIIYFIIFPIPAKWFVLIFGGIAFYNSLGPSRGVAEFAHLGGMLIGFLYLKAGGPGGGNWRSRYDRWRRERARRKFGVVYGSRPDGPPEDLRWRRWK